MISYHLVCAHGHSFDAWFRGSADFDAQSAQGIIACPQCGSSDVVKKLMAPSVVTARSKAARPRENNASQSGEMTESTPVPDAGPVAPSTPVPTQPVALAEPQMRELAEAIRKVRQHVVDNAENVGTKFAEVARRIHYGEEEKRGIYGETTAEDASALLEEGVEVFPLPVLPEDRN